MFALKRASLKAPQAINKKAASHPSLPSGYNTHKYSNSPGAIPNEIKSDRESNSIAGTIFIKSDPRIVKINDFYVEASPAGCMLVIFNKDVPGIIGQIGTLLGKNKINIAGMSFGREKPGKRAITVLNIDCAVPKDILEEIRSAKNIDDAEMVIKSLKINRRLVDISPMVDVYFADHPTDDLNRRGNKMARERMSVLYDISAEIGALVIGTSNKSEIKMGYGTLFGDLACAINPLGNLYKIQLRQLATHLGVPERILAKPPSADLWQGQTDEGELGLTYKNLDTLLYYMEDLNYDEGKLEELGFPPDLMKKVKSRIKANTFKGRLPIIADLP